MAKDHMPEPIRPAPGNHNCWIYETDEEHRAFLTPYIRAALENNEKFIYIAEHHSEKEILKYLKDDGIDPRPYLKSGQLVIRDAREVYASGGAFVPERVIGLLGEETRKALDEGYCALRTSGEMSWATRGIPGSERLIEYEAKLNQFFPFNECYGLCQYDRRSFGPEVLVDILRTHPGVVLGTEHFDNHYYVPPEIFLSTDPEETTFDLWVQNIRERRDSERALAESEEKHRRIVDSAAEGIGAVDPDQKITFANQRLADMLGYTVDELVGRSMLELLSQRTLEETPATFDRLRTGIGEELDVEWVCKDGSPLYTKGYAMPLADDNGDFAGSFGFFTDVTDRKQAEEALAESEDKYRLMIEIAQEGIWIIDDRYKVTFLNQRQAEMLGYSREEILGRTVFEFMDEDWQEIARRQLEQRRSGKGTDIEFEWIRKDGSRLFTIMSTSPLVDKNGNFLGSLGFLTDITSRKLLEEALRENEEKYRSFIENANEGVVTLDREGVITFANPLMAEILGYEIDEVLGHSVLEFMDEHWQKIARDKLRERGSGESAKYEFEFLRKDQTRMYAKISASAVKDDSGRVVGSLALVSDMTPAREAEEALRRSEEQFRSIYDHSPIGIMTFEESGLITSINQAAREMFGVPEGAKMAPINLFEIRYMSDGEKEQLRRGESIFKEVEIDFGEAAETGLFVTEQTGIRYFSGTITPLPLSNGQGSGYLGQVQDITERKLAEQALAWERDFSDRLIQSLPVFFVVAASDGEVRVINEAFLEATGYTAEEVLHKDYGEYFIPERDRAGFPDLLRRLSTSAEPVYNVNPIRRKDGSEILVEWHNWQVLEEDGGVLIIAAGVDITERQRAEEALRESEEKYRTIIDTVNEGIWAVDAEQRITFVNRRMADLLGYPVDEIIGRSALDFLSEEARHGIAEKIGQRRSGFGKQYDVELVRKDGSSLYMIVGEAPIRDREGNFIGSFGLFTDISERKQAERALEESEEKYRRIVEHAQEGIWVNGPDRTTIFVNDRMAEMLGYDTDEMIGWPMYRFMADGDADSHKPLWERRRRGIDEQFEIRMKRKDGGIIYTHVSAASIIDEAGEFQGSVSLITDITEKKKAEDDLRETRDYLDSLIRYANAPIIVWDPGMRIIRFNNAFEKMTGYHEQEVIGRPLDTLFSAEDKEEALAKIGLALAGEYWESVEIPIRRKDGEIRMALWNSANVYGDDGGLIATIAQGQDITERKKSEKELLESRERLQRSFDVVGDAMFVIDPDCRIQQHNRGLCELLGREDDLTGKTCFELIHCSEQAPQGCLMREAMRTEGPVKAEVYEETTGKFLAAALAPIFNEDGKVELAVHVISDITERKKAEEELRQARDYLDSLFRYASAPIVVWDPELTITRFNQAFSALTGIPSEAAIGNKLVMLFPEERREECLLEIERAQSGERLKSVEIPILCRNGEEKIVLWDSANIRGKDNELIATIAQGQDITERKKMEDALRESEEKYRLIVDGAHEGIWTVDREGRVVFANERMAEMLGYDPEEIIGRLAGEFMDEEARGLYRQRLKDRASGKGESYEMEFVRKDGSRLYASVSASPLVDENGDFLGSLGLFSDITSRKQAEDALAREMEVNRSIADLSATLLTKASIRTISVMVLEIAYNLTGSSVGYVGYINSETGNFFYVSMDVSEKPEKVFNFNEMESIPVVAVEKRRGFFTNSASGERRAFRGPLHGSSLERFIWVPSLMGETQVGQISLANPERDYDEKDLELLQRLADLYAVALLRMWSEDELEEHRAHLEDLVKQRTMELNEINRQLEEEVLERKSKEKALSQTASRLRALSVRLQSIREEERRAIALDVHDKLGQSLTGLKISASLLKKKYSQHAGMCERIDGMSELIDDTIRTVREISSDLRPGMLDDFGLLPALDWQLKKFGETTGLGYELQSNLGEEIIDKDVTVALFRIAQEALTNVARHARATRVDVSLFRDEGNLTLKIADDGKGISESQTSGFASLGILGMKERALVFGGKVDLKGEPGKGTILIAQIPYGQVRMDISGEDFEVRS